MPNRLAAETSPYLRQHAENPVDWYPWGEEALAAARATDRPLLVSIGYSACHWCHVMAHESFEDPDTAALMNERFVCIKVDREERPDVDAVCMQACQAITGQGGWPLNAFLTPDQAPFFAGTYFPPQPRHGLPSWRAVLDAVWQAWSERREQVREQGERILGGAVRLPDADTPLSPALLDQAIESLRAAHDPVNGGTRGAPKFPQASVIEFALARGEHQLALHTLRAMAAGGIHDQVGGGFARYSVDATWTVPHFEKMLYDNALLARAYLHGFQVSGEPRLRAVCEQTLDFVLRELRDPDGGFWCALDADSEGVEGKFYVWTPQQLRETLGEDAEAAIGYFGPRPFEHGHVLEGRGPVPERLPEIRCALYGARAARVRPGTDDKRLTAWNALMISALADAGAALARADYLAAAVACAELVTAGELARTGAIAGYLDDYAFTVEALLTLYEATFEPRWFARARALADEMIERFADPAGGFFTTAAGHASGFARRHDLEDSPVPAGGSAAAFGLLRLSRLTGEHEYERLALGVLEPLAAIVGQHPGGFGHALAAIDFHLAPVREVAIVGDGDALAAVVRGAYRPHVVLAGGGGAPLLDGRGTVDGRAAAYVCERFACRAPVTDAASLAALL